MATENYLSPWAALNSLMKVRIREHKGRNPKVSEFFGESPDINDEFEIEIPSGCRPGSRIKPKKPLTKAQKMGKKNKNYTLI